MGLMKLAIRRIHWQQNSSALLTALIISLLGMEGPLFADGPLSQLYWCPSRSGAERLQASPASDCEPLLGVKDQERRPEKPMVEKPGVADNVETAAQAYLTRHRRLMASVVDKVEDPTHSELLTLEDQATTLLREMDAAFPAARFKGATVMSQNLVIALAEARQQLRRLRKERQALDQAREAADQMDYESSGREQQRINAAQEQLNKELRPPKQPSRALTGKEIQSVPLTGPSYKEGEAKVGPDVGTSRFNDMSKTGPDSVGDSRFNDLSRTGPDSLGDSRFNNISQTGPDSVGNSRFNEISRTGPGAVGNSSMNDISKTGQGVGNSDFNTRR